MDGFDFHPYTVPQSLVFEKGYPSPRHASVANLPRLYQAFYDAFNGSPQKTIGQQKGGGLPVSLNEVGIQTEPNGNEYFGFETSATSAGGMVGEFATAEYQSEWYLKMLKLVSCDPNIRIVNIFHLLDESVLSGLAERPLLRRPRAEAVGADRVRVDQLDRRPLQGDTRAVEAGRAAGGGAHQEESPAHEGDAAEQAARAVRLGGRRLR